MGLNTGNELGLAAAAPAARLPPEIRSRKSVRDGSPCDAVRLRVKEKLGHVSWLSGVLFFARATLGSRNHQKSKAIFRVA